MPCRENQILSGNKHSPSLILYFFQILHTKRSVKVSSFKIHCFRGCPEESWLKRNSGFFKKTQWYSPEVWSKQLEMGRKSTRQQTRTVMIVEYVLDYFCCANINVSGFGIISLITKRQKSLWRKVAMLLGKKWADGLQL